MITCIMAGNSDKYLELCIKAIEPQVDKVVICYDTTSKDKTYDIIIGAKSLLKDKLDVIERPYEHDYNIKNANSNQRNFYLEYLKKNYMGEWCLCLDADEIVDDKVIEFEKIISELENNNHLMLSPKMEHFIGDFGHVDATHEVHHVINRLFKIVKDIHYPDGEHPVLVPKNKQSWTFNLDLFTIYHLAYCREMFYILDRYKNHLEKSEIHSSDFLQDWTYMHYTGKYPKRDFDIVKLPKILKDYLLIDDDFFYFSRRGLETKHILMVKQWQDYFTPSSVLNCGDGIGVYTKAFEVVGNTLSFGFDISNYAVARTIANRDHYWQDNITTFWKTLLTYDLVTVIDVLEHLDESQLRDALVQIYNHGNKFIFSIPFEGDPNLYADSTHKIFKSKEWWIEQLEKVGFKIDSTPENFYYKNQILVAKK